MFGIPTDDLELNKIIDPKKASKIRQLRKLQIKKKPTKKEMMQAMKRQLRGLKATEF